MKRALPFVAAVALAACSSETPADGENAEDFARRAGNADGAVGEVPSVPVAEVNAQPLRGSEGQAVLTPLSQNAPKALGKVKGGCAFAYEGRTLLSVGAGDTTDDRGKGVLVLDGNPIILPGAEAGGPQVMESGPTLNGGGYTVAVMRAEGSPEAVAAGNRWSADLVVRGPQGETKFSPGTWTCRS